MVRGAPIGKLHLVFSPLFAPFVAEREVAQIRPSLLRLSIVTFEVWLANYSD